MTTVIKAENISKQYRLGYVGSGSIKDDVKRWWYGIRGKEDPLLTVGESNDRTRKGESDYVWALKDINFEIQQGDTVGIIGRNGAGKSTLLKLLSKVTAPTTGNIKVKGRIASLLEVGTGFHGELTGRENIYLNGAIMGMRKHEITRRLDEIVDFAGVERYLDTPVKRYSSGMYVRLGFAVAAHLDNEILIVDEVLAVGDAEFQKKCLGKMGDVAKGEGRTVLFVSHNMAAMQNLCKHGVLLENGKIKLDGIIENVLNSYMDNSIVNHSTLSSITKRKGNGNLIFTDCKVISLDTGDLIQSFGKIKIELFYNIDKKINIKSYKIDLGINNYLGDRVAWLSTTLIKSKFNINNNKVVFEIDNLTLAPGDYSFNLFAEINNEVADWLTEVSPFIVVERDYYNNGTIIPKNQGSHILKFNITN
jgi:lipopolysaccharide transport system ATP-binding protein